MQIIGPDGVQREYADGTNLARIAEDYRDRFASPVALGFLNGRAVPLTIVPQEGEHIDFLDIDSAEGYNTYISTFLFTLIAATRKMRPEVHLEVQNTFGSALYCDIKNKIVLSKYDLADIEACMKEMIEQDEPVKAIVKKKQEAWPYIQHNFYRDQAPLLAALPDDASVIIYELEGVRAYFVRPILPSLGLLKDFELMRMGSGLLLRYGRQGAYDHLEPYKERKKLAAVYAESEKMGQRLHCPTVAALNQFIERGDSRGIIQVCEAQHEKRIAQIADAVASEEHGVRLVLIAGPSSSGKTTFSQRLAVQLRVNGLRPVPISMDNYFKRREETPRLPDGSYDFESIDALDTDLFNDHLERLLRGEMVEIPHFSFRTGERSYRGQKEQLGSDGVVIVEGIHGLNEKVSASVPRDRKLKIYISALTPLSFDDYNRIPTTDMRLLRRMVRDSQFRSHDAVQTIRNWPKVRAGEEKYIFPFSEEADILFNTTLIYELAVFKKYACPLLEKIPHSEPEFPIARKLLDMLSVVRPIDDRAIPNNSIIREFIGNSIFGDLL